MRLKQLFQDDNAVSPVIGVILMVAITVILAAVIATFVLGLGEQISETSPNTSFSFDYEASASGPDDWSQGSSGSNAVVTITHAGGPNINAEQLAVSGSSVGLHSSNSAGWYVDGSTYGSTPYPSGTEISAGDSVEYAMASDDRIQVTWENEEGTQSSTLQSFRGPDA